jgi:histidyl-tRNA synthetase
VTDPRPPIESRTLIEPRTLKGFRDHLPPQALAREGILDIARRVYRSYGFVPIDTPALEYLEILTGKGSDETDKQLYRFTDHGGREVGMRFDLTIPLARFAAQHIGTLGTPFKRYHMATVWRGENTQRGRYREFMQCDFDTIGTTSALADGNHPLTITATDTAGQTFDVRVPAGRVAPTGTWIVELRAEGACSAIALALSMHAAPISGP